MAATATDVELAALRAMAEALCTVDLVARHRILQWACDRLAADQRLAELEERGPAMAEKEG